MLCQLFSSTYYLIATAAASLYGDHVNDHNNHISTYVNAVYYLKKRDTRRSDREMVAGR
jgi:hypothetical protein